MLVEKELPFGIVGKISCKNSDGHYWFEGHRFNHDTICGWVARGFLSWVEEEKSLEDKILKFLQSPHHEVGLDKATIIAKIAKEHYLGVFDRLVERKEMTVYDTVQLKPYVDKIRKAIEEAK